MAQERTTQSETEMALEYADAAIAHGRAVDAADPDRANVNANTIGAIYRELRRRGPESQTALLPLLDHIDPNVRAWAGAHALEFAPDRGERVLTKLARGHARGLVGFTAEVTLQEWRKGRLRFP